MPLDQELSRRNLEKLERHLSKLSSKSTPEHIHRFRTYSRRVEVLLDEISPDPSKNEKKLVKLLGRARKKAGRVRDLDVQISLLRSLKIPQAPDQKSQLLRSLTEERAKREKKLSKAFDEELVGEIQKRLRRAERDLEIPTRVEPVDVALRLLSRVDSDPGKMTEETLHQYRIAGKRARYVAELTGDTPAAQRVISLLKSMQDVIGDWHDWLQLTDRAEKLFGKAQDSPLVAELANVTRAKFREAAMALTRTKAALLTKPAASEPAPQRKQPAMAATNSAA